MLTCMERAFNPLPEAKGIDVPLLWGISAPIWIICAVDPDQHDDFEAAAPKGRRRAT